MSRSNKRCSSYTNTRKKRGTPCCNPRILVNPHNPLMPDPNSTPAHTPAITWVQQCHVRISPSLELVQNNPSHTDIDTLSYLPASKIVDSNHVPLRRSALPIHRERGKMPPHRTGLRRTPGSGHSGPTVRCVTCTYQAFRLRSESEILGRVCVPFWIDGRLEDECVARDETFEPTRPPVSVNLEPTHESSKYASHRPTQTHVEYELVPPLLVLFLYPPKLP